MDGSLDTRGDPARFRLTRRAGGVALAVVLASVLATLGVLVAVRGSDGDARRPADVTWRLLPPAPIAPDFARTGVWTGRELLVYGRDQQSATDERGEAYATGSANVAAAYDPAAGTWRKLAPPTGSPGAIGRVSAVWSGEELLVWGPGARDGGGSAFNPATDRWRRFAPPPAGGGIVVWTGREMVGWGGGCCGDASADGAAYDPAENTWRSIARSPLAASQQPVGSWTGRELIVLVTGRDPDGKPSPARLARAAAYDPAADTWRRIAPLPEPREGAAAAWDGRELLVVGGSGVTRGGRAPARVGFAYDPAADRWRRLAPMPIGRVGAQAAWTGRRLVLWGGLTAAGAGAAGGLSYDPAADRWSPLPVAPLPRRLEATAAWTGRSLIVWGGVRTDTWGRYRSVGAAFTPRDPEARTGRRRP
jgi:hypothetical protein